MGWRLSLAIQFIPALIFGVGLPFLPETYGSTCTHKLEQELTFEPQTPLAR